MAPTTTSVPTTARTARPSRAPMSTTRKAALVAGVLYLVTFATSIPALGLYDGVLNDPDFVLGAGGTNGVQWGALLEVVLGLAGIGTAIALYPIVRRHGERAALGFVSARTMEAAMIFVGVLSLLAVVTLRDDLAGASGADAAALATSGRALVAVHDWTFLLGPGLMPAVNALCLATVMYRSRLVPRLIPAIGLVGAPVLLASFVAILFGAYDQVSAPAMIAAIPIAAWELSVGIWMTVKGLRTSTTTDDRAAESAVPAAGVLATTAA